MVSPRPLIVPSSAPSAPASAPVSLEVVAGLLRGLDRQQRRAVTHGEGPLLVLAGPGSGKTRVVTRRMAWLIATRRARPEEILALTFTEKAADEMQARVDELVPYGQAETAIHTFHAFGDRLIRDHAFELGLPGEPRVLGRAEATILLGARLESLGLVHYRPLAQPGRFLGALVDLFARAKDEDVDPAAYADHAAALGAAAVEAGARAGDEPERDAAAALAEGAARQAELAGAYAAYQALLAGAGTIDHGDQLALALRLLREHPSVRQAVQRRYRYLLVDEFQDTNPAQLELVRLLAGPGRNVTVVGDDDQAIYAFRGAAVENLLGFERSFPGAATVVLRRNHRSRTPIVDAARRLIRHNDPHRLEIRAGIDKGPRAVRRARPRPVTALAFETVADEADWVAARIAERIRRGDRPEGLAVLVRTNADAEPILRSLDMAGVAWRFSGGSGLYARPVVRELLAFLRVVADLERSVDLYALATAEPYHLGGEELTAVLESARRRHRSLWATLCELVEQPGLLRLEPATRSSIARLVADLRASSDLAHRRPAGEVLYDHLRRSGRLGRLAAAGAEGERALQDVARFFAVIKAAGTLLPDDRVALLADHLTALVDGGDDPRGEEQDEDDVVSVLTVHRAKGLEFATVFLVGLADGRFPGRGRREALAMPAELLRSTSGADAEAPHAEERRLCYVAMTRARDELFLSYAARGERGRTRRPSPFLAEALDASPAVAAAADPLATITAAGTAVPERTPLPSPTATGPLVLSYSQVDTYATCPRRYQLRYEIGVPEPAHHALAYGSALHQAVAAFGISRIKGRPLDEAGILAALDAHWSGEGFLSLAHEAARYAAARDAVVRFRSVELASGIAPPSAVEERFSFQLDGDRVIGRFDRVDETAEGTVITDYKSGGDVRDTARARQKARDSLQLATYAMAHEARTGVPPAAVQLHFLDSGLVGRVPAEARKMDAARVAVRTAAEGIRRAEFPTRPDRVICAGCPFRRICPDSAA
jgi:DNA helicase-2/ATP-dependent DNA helicase PcrA